MNDSAQRRWPRPPRRTGRIGAFYQCFIVPPAVLLVCLSVLSIFSCTGEPRHPTWTGATGAEQYERLMWKSIRDRDWKEAERHLGPMFTGVNAKGQAFDRDGWLEYWKTSPFKEFSLGEVSVQPNGPDMTVTYVLHLSGTAAAGLRVLSVWQEVKGGWILTATTQTPVQSE